MDNVERMMNPNTRACVAYVAGKLISGSSSTSVYDHARSRHIRFSGSVAGSHVRIYDHDRGCHFSATLPNLYDYGRSAHVSLKINGAEFKGYDYGDGHHFSGAVKGSAVSVYDSGESTHFNYGL
jgi:hypothetical protein